jgi:TIGR03009 family protein
MRVTTSALTALLLAAAPAAAQAPPMPQPQPQQAPNALDNYLLRWEQEMQKVQTLAAQLVREEKDPQFNTAQKFVGYAQYMKTGAGPNALNLAMLEMRPEGKNEISEKFVCTGTYLYQFVPSAKEVRAHELPKPQPGQVANDNFLSFLFGMKADEAKKRYELRLVREDQNYIYVEIAPRFAQDKADFKRARIVLSRDTFLPRQLWFEQPTGTDVTWDIPAIRAGVQVNRADFDAPKPPPGWKLVAVPHGQEAPPTVRQNPGR